MFLEPHYKGQRNGWIEVICGSMFSGKTEELIRRLKRAQIAGQELAIFKPSLDVRYHQQKVVSHDASEIDSQPVDQAADIMRHINSVDVVGIDEAQFFGMDLPQVCQQLAQKGIRVIVAGLDMDFRGRPFGPMPNLLAVAEYITKVHAICQHCGNLATHSFRIALEEDQLVLGAKEQYEARCRNCYSMGNILNLKPKKG